MLALDKESTTITTFSIPGRYLRELALGAKGKCCILTQLDSLEYIPRQMSRSYFLRLICEIGSASGKMRRFTMKTESLRQSKISPF